MSPILNSIILVCLLLALFCLAMAVFHLTRAMRFQAEGARLQRQTMATVVTWMEAQQEINIRQRKLNESQTEANVSQHKISKQLTEAIIQHVNGSPVTLAQPQLGASTPLSKDCVVPISLRLLNGVSNLGEGRASLDDDERREGSGLDLRHPEGSTEAD